MVSGTAYNYNIQGRDFYHNNVQTLATSLSDLSVEIVNKTSGDVIATGGIADHASNGVYTASVTPTTAGEYYLNIMHSGLHFDDSPYSIKIDAAAATNAAKSNFTGLATSYKTGDTFSVTISANDLNTNLRTASTAETFVVTLTEDTSSTAHTLTANSNSDGTYTATHVFSVVDTYTLTITFGGTAINGSPKTAIQVEHGLVQAKESDLVSSSTPLRAGDMNIFKIQAQDYYGNVVVNTNEYFGYLIRHDTTLVETEASINYNFELYEASFNLTDAGTYSSVIRLDQEQGLLARYYKTTDFTSLVESLNRNDLDSEKYTKIDS